MSEPINHHYLPIFYLRRWCNADGKLVRYYRPRDSVLAAPIAPKSTAYEPFLYSLTGFPPAWRQAIETQFMNAAVDDPAAMALDIMLRRDWPKLTPELRIAWTRFLIAIRLRDPQTIKELEELALATLKESLAKDPEEYLAVKAEDDPETLYDWMLKHNPKHIENIGKLFLPGAIDNEKVGNHTINMRWTLLDLNTSTVRLMTSDRPYLQTHGLADDLCISALSVSPTKLFIATNKISAEQQFIASGPTKIVKWYNQNVVENAVKHVYADTDSHLRFVERRLARAGVEPKRGPWFVRPTAQTE